MNRIRENNLNTKEYWDSFINEAYLNADKRRGKCKFKTVIDNFPDDIANKEILDVGCLAGNFLDYLIESNVEFKTFTGIDLSEKSIEEAQKKYHEDKYYWKCLDCRNTKFVDASFDVITAMEILEHVDNPEIFLAEAKRLLRKDGVLLITVPNERRIEDASHVWSYSTTDIFEMLFTISKNVNVQLTCSGNRNIFGKAIIDFESHF
jgi:2-polyprenyl-3-methyl-5-hydroxy-6-metoxy-1,4-benzoquinol methylase